jgi:HAD superfamily hydrolase (TIGR01509 family)
VKSQRAGGREPAGLTNDATVTVGGQKVSSFTESRGAGGHGSEATVIEAVLFDNDGLLVDTETAFFEVTRDAFAKEGIVLPTGHWAKTYLGEGRATRDIAADLGMPADRIDAFVQGRNLLWKARMAAGVSLRPKVRETLRLLEGKVRMAIVTGSPREQFDEVHRLTDLGDFFETVLTSEDYERSKPHPDSYVSALRTMGLPPERCIAVEDSPRGVAAATAARVRCILVPTELTDLSMCRDADFIVEDISGVVSIISGLNNPLP